MAITVQSVSTLTSSGIGSPTLDVNYPSGVAVGDLLLMPFMSIGGSATPSGWTLSETILTTPGSPTFESYVFYKIADSGDVGASTVTVTTGGDVAGGIMLRVTGHNPSSPIGADNSGQVGGSAPTSMSISGVTPTQIESRIFMFTYTRNASASVTTSNYAIATSSPTFVEHYDTGFRSLFAMSCASGIRSVDTATGAATADFSSGARHAGIILAVTPADESNTVTPAALAITSALPAFALLMHATFAASAALGITSTLPIPTPQAIAATVSNVAKTSASASNTSKNAASASNVSKSSSVWTNTQKS